MGDCRRSPYRQTDAMNKASADFDVESPIVAHTPDDDDDRDDEHDGENEAPIREVDDATEAPEEFEIDEV